MADNVTFQTTVAATPPNATIVAGDDVGGVIYQRIKVDGGADGVTTPIVAGQQARAQSLPVALSTEDAQLLTDLLAKVIASPATEAKQDAQIALLPAALGAGGGLKVDGSGTALPVSGTVTANIGTVATLSTAAKQPALGTAGTPSADVITVQGAALGTAIPTLEQSRAAAAADVHAPAVNTAAVVTYAASAGQAHVIGGIAWSYNAAPTGGNLKVEDVSGTTVFSIDITSAGPGFIPFARPKRSAAQNTALIVTLAAAGAAVTGKVSVLSHWTE